MFLRFWAAKITKNTIPAQPVPTTGRAGIVFLRFSAAPKTRFPLNPSHDRRGGNRIFGVLGS